MIRSQDQLDAQIRRSWGAGSSPSRTHTLWAWCDAARLAADRAEARRSAPLCQGVPFSAEGFRFFEEVWVQAAAGVEDLDADEAVFFPVEDDECLDAFGRAGRDAGAAAAEPLAGEVDVSGV